MKKAGKTAKIPCTRESTEQSQQRFKRREKANTDLTRTDLVEGHKSEGLRKHCARKIPLRQQKWDRSDGKEQLRNESQGFDSKA